MATNLDDAPVDDLDIPLAWLSADHTAQQLVDNHYPLWSPALFQYRTVEYVLALTVFLSDEDGLTGQPAQWPAHQWAALRERTNNDQDWASWCGDRLHQPTVIGSVASHRMARSAWQWLRGSRLLYDSACPADCGHGARWGVDLAHRALGSA